MLMMLFVISSCIYVNDVYVLYVLAVKVMIYCMCILCHYKIIFLAWFFILYASLMLLCYVGHSLYKILSLEKYHFDFLLSYCLYRFF
jgi:hypothetical protein